MILKVHSTGRRMRRSPRMAGLLMAAVAAQSSAPLLATSAAQGSAGGGPAEVRGEESTRDAAVLFEGARHAELSEGNLEKALSLYEAIIVDDSANREVAARALLRMGICHQKLGDARARAIYERVLRDYADQADVAADARNRLAALAAAEPRTGPAEGLTTRRVLTSPPRGPQFMGAPSPDGRYLSGIDWTSGDLAVRDLATGDTRRLTDVPYPQMPLFSIFSPDSESIAYSWQNQKFFYDLRVIEVDGSSPRVLYANEDVIYVQPEAWSPDGSWILALLGRRDGTHQIAKISVKSGTAQVLKSLDWRSPRQMSLSPDGRYVAYELPPDEDKPNAHDIFLLAADGSRESALVEGPADDSMPIWTPDGKAVLFVSNRGGSYDLWAQNVSEDRPRGRPYVVKAGAGEIVAMGLTNDGSLYYGLENEARNIHTARYDPSTGKLTKVRFDGLETRAGSNIQPRWSVDGTQLAYVNLGSPALDGASATTVVIRALTTGQEKELRPEGIRGFNLGDWSLDARRILLRAYGRRGGQALYWLDTGSGELEVIRPAGEDEVLSLPELSPDGETLFFTSGYRIVARDLGSGGERQIGEVFSRNFSFTLSPDGKRIAFQAFHEQADERGPVMVISVDDEEARQVFVPNDAVWALTWTPDGRHLLAVVPAGRAGKSDSPRRGGSLSLGHTFDVMRVPVGGGEPTPTGLTVGVTNALNPPQFHPDGRTLAYLDGQNISEIWVLEKLLGELRDRP